ncbi:hypothetical protein Bca4012_092679 [Brassica carinata]|uniref:Uncharacterized protein n=1 Tax=Brassica oleracea TaxID=3712 RepID=A0A3P6G4Z4_BRAOL|nr:unnamed protein product [Brassica oleracea]
MMMKNLCAHVKWKQMNVSLETCLRIRLICTFLCLNIFHGLRVTSMRTYSVRIKRKTRT